MSLSYKERRGQARRLLILEILDRESDGGLSEPFLARALLSMREEMSGKELNAHVSWLAERGLVDVERLESIFLATITPDGHDVAVGAEKVDGVAAAAHWLRRPTRG